MIRKIFLFGTFLLAMVGATAQTVGEWNIYTRFTGKIDDIVETADKVFYTSGNRLFSYDKVGNETIAYTTNNKLNDTNVREIRYNPDGKYLFIAYDNGNVDLLYDNGRVVNMSDIKDANLVYNKGINSAIFANDRIYCGTEFGIVIFDDQQHNVVESGIYGESIDFVFPVEDLLFIQYKGFHYAPLKGYHNTLDKFKEFKDPDTGGSFNTKWLDVAGNNKTVIFSDINEYNNSKYYTFKVEGGVPQKADLKRYSSKMNGPVKKTKSGNYITSNEQIIFINEDGEPVKTIAIPSELQGKNIATQCNEESVWVGDEKGVANYDIKDGNVTVLSDKFKPEGIVTDEVFFMQFDQTGALWLGNLGVTLYKGISGGGGDRADIAQALTRIKKGKIEDMNVYDAQLHIYWPMAEQTKNNNKQLYGGCTGFAIDPENPDRYYQGNNLEGLFVIENNHQVFRFSWEDGNAPFPGYGYTNRVMDVKFDPEGNLWVGTWTGSGLVSPVQVLPKEKLKTGKYEDIQKSDWRASKHLGVDGGDKDLTLLICKKSPVVFTWHGKWQNPLGVLKTNGTWANMDDDEYFEMEQPVDQDLKSWMPSRIICAAEDKNGKVWIGGSEGGIIEIADPSSLTPSSRITRIKVPRNDGTNYADYLCETEQVNGIAVDNSNRKWIATENSGVYLVSENGDKILEQFTMSNSPLPSNQVFSVACDPNSNTVYFGMATGLVSYNSSSSPAALDFSEVYAYPNPVRPDFTGYITIAGLKDNSLVKITDASGHVVYQTRSEGGMAIWDGFDSNHNRVKTGVYYVFASQNENDKTTGAVTKIMVVQ